MIRKVLILVCLIAGGAAVAYMVDQRQSSPPPRPYIHPVVLSALEPYCASEPDPRKHRVLAIGWDGADFRYIDPLLDAGKLPNLEALIQRGVSGRLESTIIPISSAAWTSCITGRSPAETGIFSFFKTVPGTYDIELINSLDRRAVPLWRILNHHDKETIIFGMPVTYPVEPVKGIMVAGMLAPEKADFAWPPGLAGALRSTGFIPDLGVWREVRILNKPILYNQLEIKRYVLSALLSGNEWDAAFVVFKSLDVLKHRGTEEEVRDRVEELYIYLDKVLGNLVGLAGENTDVLLLSDHGFTTYRTALNVNGWLVEKGFASLNETKKEDNLDRNRPIAETRVSSHSFEMSLLNVARSSAITGPAEGNFGSIQVNLSGREPQGNISAEQQSDLVDEILDSLRAAINPVHGGPLVRRAFRTSSLYQGPYSDLLPDILFEVDERIMVQPFTRIPSTEPLAAPFSDHVLEGIFIAAGPSFPAREERGEASIMDIAPTVLHLLDLPVHNEMDGEVLERFLNGGRSVRYEDEPAGLTDGIDGDSFTDEERKELETRLKSMSYTR